MSQSERTDSGDHHATTTTTTTTTCQCRPSPARPLPDALQLDCCLPLLHACEHTRACLWVHTCMQITSLRVHTRSLACPLSHSFSLMTTMTQTQWWQHKNTTTRARCNDLSSPSYSTCIPRYSLIASHWESHRRQWTNTVFLTTYTPKSSLRLVNVKIHLCWAEVSWWCSQWIPSLVWHVTPVWCVGQQAKCLWDIRSNIGGKSAKSSAKKMRLMGIRNIQNQQDSTITIRLWDHNLHGLFLLYK